MERVRRRRKHGRLEKDNSYDNYNSQSQRPPSEPCQVASLLKRLKNTQTARRCGSKHGLSSPSTTERHRPRDLAGASLRRHPSPSLLHSVLALSLDDKQTPFVRDAFEIVRPRSSNLRPEPATRSRTVLETTTSSGAAIAATRTDMHRDSYYVITSEFILAGVQPSSYLKSQRVYSFAQ